MQIGSFYNKGVSRTSRGYQFVFRVENNPQKLEIRLYHKDSLLKAVSVPNDYRCGNLFSVILEPVTKAADSYAYYADGEPLLDPFATGVADLKEYGKGHPKEGLRYLLPSNLPKIRPVKVAVDYSDTVIYGLHVRGFTKGKGSGVKAKGTFLGITEKLDYIKKLGVTAIELMPCYEFDELDQHTTSPFIPLTDHKLNFWGYKPGYYYAPKATYAKKADARIEFAETVDAVHAAGLEMLLQFYFDGTVSETGILDILRYYVLTYRIDGFHLIGEGIPLPLLARDDVLRGIKLITENTQQGPFPLSADGCKSVAEFSRPFMIDMRKYLKGDENMLPALLYHVRDHRDDHAVVHRIAGYDGFTLLDLVSYDRKHNEANGEDNHDGELSNFSWNCGAEGDTRKRSIHALRMRQMKNALSLVFFSQGAVYIHSGDEFGQTQGGNNNPYCQDNDVTWLNWRFKKTMEPYIDFVKEIIAFRKEHKVLHQKQLLCNADHRGYGLPDLSYHGEEAWRPDLDPYSRCIGLLFCGAYAAVDETHKDHDLYIALNMHWEPHTFSLPAPREGFSWKPVMDTASEQSFLSRYSDPETNAQGDTYTVMQRSIMVFEATED